MKLDDSVSAFLVTLILIGILVLSIPFYCGNRAVKNENTAPEPVQVIEVVEEIETKTETKTSLGEFTITAYCSCEKCCGVWADGITFTGGEATEGRTIAVDPDVIPLGSTVEINGNQYVAEDIGAKILENRIDLFFVDHEDAINYGIQNHEVYLIEEV